MPKDTLMKHNLDKIKGAFVIETYCDIAFLDAERRVVEFIPKGATFTVTAEWNDVCKSYYVNPVEHHQYQNIFPLSVYAGGPGLGWRITHIPTIH
ncbi:MAG: hypothetical protein BWK73_09295 [Thiothrix lacustris]|uniref:Uncharacterized protein n=1 Tax=Thiothrix lacustris TaxID=525917 RepID=A0A1Y1QVM5_9GAMM|nr:MAG: hypothetical protein BWK73_09295 [Thiothrix lacustris]